MAKNAAVPPALEKAYAKVEAKISGDLDLFEENEVDTHEVGPWLPLGLFKEEPQFLKPFTGVRIEYTRR